MLSLPTMRGCFSLFVLFSSLTWKNLFSSIYIWDIVFCYISSKVLEQHICHPIRVEIVLVLYYIQRTVSLCMQVIIANNFVVLYKKITNS